MESRKSSKEFFQSSNKEIELQDRVVRVDTFYMSRFLHVKRENKSALKAPSGPMKKQHNLLKKQKQIHIENKNSNTFHQDHNAHL